MSVDYKIKPFHQRNDSGELDVFEAARYFSGYNENLPLSQKIVAIEESGRQGYNLKGGRVSLDMPLLKQQCYNNQQQYDNFPNAQPQQQKQQKQQHEQTKDKKLYKQPSSPGGKLAHFLNSLFSQTSSKKKKLVKSSTQSVKDDDESPSGRRKRRSSISHFRSTSSAIDAKSVYSCSSSGFRTPPPYNLNTPTKSYKDFKSFADHKEAVLATLSKYNNVNGSADRKSKPTSMAIRKEDKERRSSLNLVDENFDFRNGFIEQAREFDFSHGYQDKKMDVMIFNQDDDDGADSDSSSDLFELQIDYGYGFCSSGLPVYETTHMDNIKRSSTNAITNGPIKN